MNDEEKIIIMKNLTELASIVADITGNEWDGSIYIQKYLKKSLNSVLLFTGGIDFLSLTEEEYSMLGFIKASNVSENEEIMLIPLYLLSRIPIGTKVRCTKDGKRYTIGKDNIDKSDLHFGCIRYGIIIKENK